MRATVMIQLDNGEQIRSTTTRETLRKYFEVKKPKIEWLIAEINLNTWYYDRQEGWAQCPKTGYGADGLISYKKPSLKRMKIHGHNGRNPWSHLD